IKMKSPPMASQSDPEFPVLLPDKQPVLVETADGLPCRLADNGTEVDIIVYEQGGEVKRTSREQSVSRIADEMWLAIENGYVGVAFQEIHTVQNILLSHLVIAIQEEQVGGLCMPDTEVSRSSRSLVFLAQYHMPFVFKLADDRKRLAVRGAIVDNNDGQEFWFRAGQNALNGFVEKAPCVEAGNDDRQNRYVHPEGVACFRDCRLVRYFKRINIAEK